MRKYIPKQTAEELNREIYRKIQQLRNEDGDQNPRREGSTRSNGTAASSSLTTGWGTTGLTEIYSDLNILKSDSEQTEKDQMAERATPERWDEDEEEERIDLSKGDVVRLDGGGEDDCDENPGGGYYHVSEGEWEDDGEDLDAIYGEECGITRTTTMTPEDLRGIGENKTCLLYTSPSPRD